MTIGAYDGVHLGHQALLGELRRRAEASGLETAVVTFDRHPAAVVRPDSVPKQLCDLDQKLELLEAAGVERTVIVRFDEERANESADEFVHEIIERCLGASLVVVGEDFHFGHGRKGNVALLRELGAGGRFEVDGVSLAGNPDGDDADRPISSTRIRALVAQGNVAEAAELLGRPHQVRGEVVHGDNRGGAELGFPTANLEISPTIAVPATGIYAAWYHRPGGERHPAAVSVGRRPTFYGDAGELLVEAFLLDFTGDLYGEMGGISFVSRLRNELAFDSADALVEQMDRDVTNARQILLGPP